MINQCSNIKEVQDFYTHMDVLLVQDGGCAPGYNPVTAFLVNDLEKNNRSCFIAYEGFKSLVSGKIVDFRRLAYDKNLFHSLEHIPGVINAAPLSEDRGASFRTERYREFLKDDRQKEAASHIHKRGVKALITIGGNGTFAGTKDLCRFLDKSIQVFFIPVTIDSDVSHTECIGQHTGVECGAEKIRCYMADARTHKRIYIVEMMGARGGFHALHSCLGARAHLAVLPGTELDIRKAAQALAHKEEAVIVVAEGYKEKERIRDGFEGNAALYFCQELLSTNISLNKRIVCEAFARDIRGAAPNNIDITLCQQMAHNTTQYLVDGKSRLMSSVSSGHSKEIPFDVITTENHIHHEFYKISNRLY